MNERFELLLSKWARDPNVTFKEVERQIRCTLEAHGIRVRQDDGDLSQLNFSLPQSSQVGIVLGLRYLKRDGTLTEDLFLCTRQSEHLEITPYYRGGLQSKFPEYRGTHKQQVDVAAAARVFPPDPFSTSANTVTFTSSPKT